jgi:hypothetical protein
MSLTDLKKSNNDKKPKKNFTVDEFIADAENYAKGNPALVSSELTNPLNLTQAIAAAKNYEQQKQDEKSHKPFRHATFTLSEEAIEQLQELAQVSKLAKSRIIRVLINEFCNKDQKEKLHQLFVSKTN